jgi:hypothetical protein
MDRAQDQALVEAQARAQARAEAAVAYVRPKLLEPQVDLKHCSYMSAVFKEVLGHVCSRTARTVMPIHDLWVPTYVK